MFEKSGMLNSRWSILVCCSIISFVTDFFGDEPSVLVQRLTGTADACASANDSSTCQHFDVQQFNMLFSSSAWAAAVAAVFAGLLIDRHGCRIALWITGTSMVLGALLFVIGTYMQTSNTAFLVMIFGEILFGLGNGASDVVSHRVKASWFFYKELTFAFAVHIMSGRFGSATVFYGIGSLVEIIGLQGCAWIGFILISIGGVTCFVLSFLTDRCSVIKESTRVALSFRFLWDFVESLDGIFVCFVFVVFLYYGTVATFTANGPNFISSVFGRSETTASYIVGLIYLISPLAVIFGWLTDRYGFREYWLCTAAAFLFAAFLSELTVPHLPAGALVLITGVGYNTFSPTFWSSVALVVAPSCVGTAIGVLKFFHFAGTGSLTAIAGSILNNKGVDSVDWSRLFILLALSSGFCLLVTFIVIYINSRSGHRLTPSQTERDKRNGILEVTPLRLSFSDDGKNYMKERIEEPIEEINLN